MFPSPPRGGRAMSQPGPRCCSPSPMGASRCGPPASASAPAPAAGELRWEPRGREGPLPPPPGGGGAGPPSRVRGTAGLRHPSCARGRRHGALPSRARWERRSPGRSRVPYSDGPPTGGAACGSASELPFLPCQLMPLGFVLIAYFGQISTCWW